MKGKRYLTVVVCSLALFLLILDARTAVSGVQEGIWLCLTSLLPALFPFSILTKILNTALVGRRITALRPIGRLCGIPEGSESILVLGILGGYPVGAQMVSDAYRCGALNHKDAARLLGFCSNAGPAFIFGMLGGLFRTPTPLWVIFLIQPLSAVLVGILLPGKSNRTCTIPPARNTSLPHTLKESLKAMALVSGWVVVFRVILVFCQRWFMWLLPQQIQIILSGFLELANGCIGLYSLKGDGLKFVLSCAFLSFGGICVAMQTASIAENIGKVLYIPGKLLQCAISVILAYLAQFFLFPPTQQLPPSPLMLFCTLPIIITVIQSAQNRKKIVAITESLVYNE